MARNKQSVLFLVGLTVGMFLLASCGGGSEGGSGGDSSTLPIMLVSIDSTGTQGNQGSYNPVVSSSGRYVAFDSNATNLVSTDTNNHSDVFFHDTDTGITSRVSVSAAGTQGNNHSVNPSISSDGRYIAFQSSSSNFVANDGNNRSDIFVYDTTNGMISRVSSSSAGTQSNGYSYSPFISSNGRYVTFHSTATNLVQNDINGFDDVFVHDTVTSMTSRVSVSSAGTEGDGGSRDSVISSDGLYVAFSSDAENLDPNDNNNTSGIFFHDSATGITSRVSVSTAGTQGYGASFRPSMSSDGTYIVFESSSITFVQNDTNNATDIFVHDTSTGITSRVSVSTAGTQANLSSNYAALSPNGRYVTFTSIATNLVSDDTNSLTDIFVHDIGTGITSRVSVSTAGTEGNGNPYDPAISSNGRYVVFESDSDNLIDGTTLSGIRPRFMAPVP